MLHFEICCGDVLVTFFGYRSLTDFGMNLGRFGTPFGFPLALFGSLLAPFRLSVASFWLTLYSLGDTCLLAYLASHFLIFHVTGLYFFTSPYKFLENSAALPEYGAWSTGRGQLSRQRRRSAAPLWDAKRA